MGVLYSISNNISYFAGVETIGVDFNLVVLGVCAYDWICAIGHRDTCSRHCAHSLRGIRCGFLKMITPEELGELIYDKLEHLRLTKSELQGAKRELRKLERIVRSQTRRNIYWTKEQRREVALVGIVEGLEVLVRELEKGINTLYADLREMGG